MIEIQGQGQYLNVKKPVLVMCIHFHIADKNLPGSIFTIKIT